MNLSMFSESRRCHGDNELIKAENGENGGDLAIDNNYDMVASGKCKVK